jgi:hypothetical protein
MPRVGSVVPDMKGVIVHCFFQKKALGHTLILSEVGRTVQYRQSVPKGLLQNPDQRIFKSYSINQSRSNHSGIVCRDCRTSPYVAFTAHRDYIKGLVVITMVITLSWLTAINAYKAFYWRQDSKPYSLAYGIYGCNLTVFCSICPNARPANFCSAIPIFYFEIAKDAQKIGWCCHV